MSNTLGICCLLLALGLAAAPAIGQDPPAGPDGSTPAFTTGPADPLGPRFESQAAGIAFRPPAGMEQLKRAGVVEEVGEFVDRDRKWHLKVTRITLQSPLPLAVRDDPRTAEIDESQRPGMLETAGRKLLDQHLGATLLRQDLINVGPHDAGVLILRYSVPAGRVLEQQAVIAANDQLYYVFDLATPSTKPTGASEEDEDPAERLAVETFNAMLDTVQLLDRTAIVREQEDRLFRTRSALVNFTRQRIEQALQPEQFYRLLKDGKDIGYSYAAEATAERGGQSGFAVAIYSETAPEPGRKIQAAAEMFCSMDRGHEAWASVINQEQVKDGKAVQAQVNEFGASDRQVTRELDEREGALDRADPKQPPMRIVERYALSVTQLSRTLSPEPVEKQLPPFYLPQAMGQILPRLLPLNQPKGYLFATWVGSEREVMMRYVDVEREQQVRLDGGRPVRAVVVRDRIGLEGQPTLHYLSPDGRYLGSANQATGITVLATDGDTIRRLWPEAKLTRPYVLDKPRGLP